MAGPVLEPRSLNLGIPKSGSFSLESSEKRWRKKCNGVCGSYYVGELTWLNNDRPDLLEAHGSYFVKTKFFFISHSRYVYLSVIYIITGLKLKSPRPFVSG